MTRKYIIVADDSINGFDEGIAKLEREWGAEEIEPCEDCISREAVIKHICESKECYKDDWCKGRLYKRCYDLQWVYALPSVTPQPKTGHWIEHPHEWGDNWQYSKYECSVCHNWALSDDDFCPNCGAKMEVEENG